MVENNANDSKILLKEIKDEEVIANSHFDPDPLFYGKAKKYWSTVPATVNGMLGGLSSISPTDIQGSAIFLRDLQGMTRNRALDCGAGIGRVSKNLLIPRFRIVDMVEQDANFTQKARELCPTAGDIYTEGLQEFIPAPDTYDLVWCQWVLGHLTDDDLLLYFGRMKRSLTPNGYFVMKENVTSSQELEVDDNDSSVTRSLKMYHTILREAGFRIVKTTKQQNFPKMLYPVYMIACQPASKTE